MARIALVVAMLAVTIYAAADWYRTPEDEMPGKIAKPIWLMIILFTATVAAIGPIAWLVLRWVSRAEKKQTRTPQAPKRPSAPDADPELLFPPARAAGAPTATHPTPPRPRATRPTKGHRYHPPQALLIARLRRALPQRDPIPPPLRSARTLRSAAQIRLRIPRRHILRNRDEVRRRLRVGGAHERRARENERRNRRERAVA